MVGDEYTIANTTVWPWSGNVVLGSAYDATKPSDAGNYKHMQRQTREVAARPAARRGRIVDHTNGSLNKQLHKRHDASDFDANTEDKRQGQNA